jgi:hypothetical protein
MSLGNCLDLGKYIRRTYQSTGTDVKQLLFDLDFLWWVCVGGLCLSVVCEAMENKQEKHAQAQAEAAAILQAYREAYAPAQHTLCERVDGCAGAVRVLCCARCVVLGPCGSGLLFHVLR